MDMDELEYTLDKEGSLVREISIKKIKPCILSGAEGMIRVLMQTDAELEGIIPSMVARYPPGKVNYIERKKVLTLSLYDRLITLYPSGKISMNKTRDKEEAIEIMKVIIKDINQAHQELQEGVIEDYSAVQNSISSIGPLAIYDCLPQTSCGDCGEATCMAFAIRLLAGEVMLDACTPLHDSENAELIKCLEGLLGSSLMQTMGWEG